jgi:hypothetical protein
MIEKIIPRPQNTIPTIFVIISTVLLLKICSLNDNPLDTNKNANGTNAKL